MGQARMQISSQGYYSANAYLLELNTSTNVSDNKVYWSLYMYFHLSYVPYYAGANAVIVYKNGSEIYRDPSSGTRAIPNSSGSWGSCDAVSYNGKSYPYRTLLGSGSFSADGSTMTVSASYLVQNSSQYAPTYGTHSVSTTADAGFTPSYNFYISMQSNNYIEIMANSRFRAPTWSRTDGQNDIVWYALNSGSWGRGGRTYSYAVGAIHNNASLDDIWDTHVYGPEGDGTCYFTCCYYPRLYIQYNAQGGSSTPATQTKYIGFDLKLASAIAKTGYSFLGWNTKADGTGSSYTASQNITYMAWNSLGMSTTVANEGWQQQCPDHSGNVVTLYAKWEANQYDIHFYKDTLGSEIETQYCIYDVESNLQKNTFIKPGYIFKGWTLTSGSSVVDYTDEQSIKNLSTGEDIILYAVWQPIEYTIQFHNTDNTIYRITNDIYDVGVYAPSTVNTIPAGYELVGWTKIKGSTAPDYNPGALIKNATETNGDVVHLYPIVLKIKKEIIGMLMKTKDGWKTISPYVKTDDGWSAATGIYWKNQGRWVGR